MKNGKIKPPGKEFTAQVSDYVPIRRRRNSPPSNVTSQPDKTKPERPWNLSDGLDSNPSLPADEGKTEHKLDTNRAQTGHKSVTELDTNRAQTGHRSIFSHSSIIETGYKPDTQPDTRSDTNWTQTAHKPDTELLFTHLVGLQRKILLFIYRACQIARARTTDPIALEHIAQSLRIRSGSVKTTLRRLEEKFFIKRVEFKNGRGGWSKYELPDNIFTALLQLETEHKLDTNWTQTAHKVGTQPDTQPDTKPSSSSSSNLDLNKLTNTADKFEGLSDEWVAIDCSSLLPIHFGRTQLLQLAQLGKLSAKEVQDSINAFSFDLEENGKGKEINGAALNYFMGILRKGPYAAPANYEPPEQRQRRLYIEAKERERKAQEELNVRMEAVEFDSWAARLSLQEKAQFVPPTDFAKPGSQGHNAELRLYFRENIWPERRERIHQEQNICQPSS